jgi:hypothetical protein
MLWLLLLPFRLFFGVLVGVVALPFVLLALPFALLLWLPFALLRLAFKLVAAVVVLPFIVLAAVAGALVAGVVLVGTVLMSLLPLLLVGACAWAIWRIATRPLRASAI